MILIDLVSSISHALPRLVAASAQRAPDETLFGPDIGYAFFQPGGNGARDRFDLEPAEAWSRLRSTTVGILGMGSTGHAVAHTARRRFGAHVVHHQPRPVGTGSDADAGSTAFDDVLSARVVCVVLPWTREQLAQVRKHKLAPVDPHTVLVVWRRSPAIERALLYLGHHYVEPVQLGDLAKVACISKFHFVRLFTATLGITPHRYQLLLRLSRAKALLREGGGITQIAHGVGFSDHSHLDRSFRVLMGMTPTQYQHSLQR
jgi:AraC-like DNA-binding protein